MKKNNYLLLTLLLACTILIGCNTQTAKAKTYDGTKFKFTDTTITISWDSPYETVADFDPEYFEILDYSIYEGYSKTYVKTGIKPTATSCKIKDLKKGYVGYWQIELHYTRKGADEYEKSYYDALFVNTTPKKLSKSKLGIFNLSSKNKTCDFEVLFDNKMSGFQLKVYRGDDTIKTFNVENSYYTEDLGKSGKLSYKKNKIYRYRARQYYLNSKKYYGAWSAYRYFVDPSADITYSSDVKGAKLTLKKVSGVKNYVVSVSTQYDKGYKKTKTITVSDKKKTVLINKIGDKKMKANTTYYIRVTPMIKVGDKTVASDVVGTTYFYNYK